MFDLKIYNTKILTLSVQSILSNYLIVPDQNPEDHVIEELKTIRPEELLQQVIIRPEELLQQVIIRPEEL